jgi:hypothetical protein
MLNPKQFDQPQLPLDWEGLERENRRDAIRGHTVKTLSPDSWVEDEPERKGYLDRPKHKEILHEGLENSSIPTNLLYKLAGPIEARGDSEDGRGMYLSDTSLIHVGGVDERPPVSVQNTLLHELGHRLDYTTGRSSTRFINTKKDKNSYMADPRAEGFADGFMDIYSGIPDPKHLSGYGRASTINLSSPTNNPEPDVPGSPFVKRRLKEGHQYNWNEGEQLIYHATRAHTAATGERISVDRRLPHEDYDYRDVDAGEHLHKLVSLSPHVEPALRNIGLWDTAKKHMYRWKANQPKVTQLSFEGDNDATSRYIPVTHFRD